MRQAYTFNAVVMSAGCESKNVDFWRFQAVGGTFLTPPITTGHMLSKYTGIKNLCLTVEPSTSVHMPRPFCSDTPHAICSGKSVKWHRSNVHVSLPAVQSAVSSSMLSWLPF